MIAASIIMAMTPKRRLTPTRLYGTTSQKTYILSQQVQLLPARLNVSAKQTAGAIMRH